MKAKEQEIRERVKRLRERVGRLSSKRLISRLDCGDRYLLVGLLDDLLRQVEYLHQLDSSRCSVVLESCNIFYGGD